MVPKNLNKKEKEELLPPAESGRRRLGKDLVSDSEVRLCFLVRLSA